MRATITLELEVQDSQRTPRDTRARARKAADSLVAWAERLRHVEVRGATLTPYFGPPVVLIDPEGGDLSDRGLWAPEPEEAPDADPA